MYETTAALYLNPVDAVVFYFPYSCTGQAAVIKSRYNARRMGKKMDKARMIYKEIHKSMTEKWFLKQMGMSEEQMK